jgi:hypothetical protein
MTDQAVAESDFLRDVQKFVSEKWRRNPCDRCGSHNWSVLPGDALLNITAHTPTIIQMGGRQLPFSASSYPVDFIAIYCENCGNTVTIYAQVFDEWRKRHAQTT